MRYKTLQSDDISFRITGIIVISVIHKCFFERQYGVKDLFSLHLYQNPEAQPYIEKARASDGSAELGRILNNYALWLYTQRNPLPQYDLAPLITNVVLEWTGGNYQSFLLPWNFYITAKLIGNTG